MLEDKDKIEPLYLWVYIHAVVRGKWQVPKGEGREPSCRAHASSLKYKGGKKEAAFLSFSLSLCTLQ